MKPKLTVLLGAGSTLNLGVDVQIGTPSTKKLTEHLLGPDAQQPIVVGKPVSIVVSMIYRALTREFDYVDFELILHAIEQLEPIVASIEDRQRVDRYRAVLSAFVEINHKLNLLNNAPLLLALRPLLLKSPSFCSRSQAESPHIFCSTMDFVRESAFAGAMRNSGSVWRNAFATRRNEAQHGLDELDRLTEQWVADHLQKSKTSKKDKELVTLELQSFPQKRGRQWQKL
jgi:hypothetical protein